ncbi:ABC transporter permease [Bacillus cytotoxicus]|uniref:ABC transporter permease n=1 Tax=Bacillus cytotoxicus TaxID=580165 RepID=UPI002446EAD3|nr:ABC transporter permease subunit [Bacillus cytotoxicus]MDH2860086.1 ABC transporter permease [Bacillus cytotoxicus]
MERLRNLLVLLKKEWTECIRDYKVVWLPLVFIGVGIMQPLTMKLLPEMIGESSGLMIDSNAKIATGNEIYAGVFGQLNQFGLLISAILLMGCIVKEEQSGILDTLFSKPINTGNYLVSKYLSNIVLMLVSIVIGSFAGVYYTNIYYSPVDMDLYIKALLIYSVWFLFVISLGVTASAVVKTQIQAAAITVIIPTILMIIGNYSNPVLDAVLPSSLSNKAVSIMLGQPLVGGWEWNVLITILIIIGLYVLAYSRMRYKRRG